MEAPVGVEPTYEGFAVPCLTNLATVPERARVTRLLGGVKAGRAEPWQDGGMLLVAMLLVAQVATPPEPHPFNAVEQTLADTAFAALQAGDGAKAATDARALVTLAPGNPRALRPLAIAL